MINNSVGIADFQIDPITKMIILSRTRRVLAIEIYGQFSSMLDRELITNIEPIRPNLQLNVTTTLWWHEILVYFAV